MLRKRRSVFQHPGKGSGRHRKRTPFYDQTLFEHLFESTPDANLLVDHQGLIVSVNHQVEVLFGYRRDQLTGKPVEQLVPDALHDAHVLESAGPLPITGKLAEGIAKKPSLRRELTARRSDGHTFPAELTLTPFQTPTGVMLLGVVRDLSVQHMREQEIADHTKLVRLLQDIAIASNEATTIDAAFQFTVDRLCEHLQWPVAHALLADEDGTLLPTPVWNKGLPEQFDAFRQGSETLRYKPGFGLPGLVMSKGQPVWLTDLAENQLFGRKEEARQAGLNTGLAIPILAGKTVVGVLEFFHEDHVQPDPNLLAVLPHLGVQVGRVVERERAQQAMRKSAAQLKMVVTNLPVILWALNREGQLIFLEGKGVKATGLVRENILGESIFNRLEKRPDLLNLFHRVLNGEAIHTEITSPNGSIFESFFTPYTGPDGAVEAIIGLSFDVSERKQMESQLEEMRQRLMDSVDAERSRLAQQLHDGPLQDLYGAFYQIQEIRNNLDEPGQELAGRALKTIQAVNATLRVICGELRPTTLIHLGLQKAMRSHAELLQDYQQRTQIYLDLDEAPEGSDQRLSHALRLNLFRIYQQLIDNVLRHSEARHCWVRLRFPEDQVVLEVQDNGKGFELPEQWIDLVRKGMFGLVATQERVQGMHGTMEIQTAPGQGTLVRVEVPR